MNEDEQRILDLITEWRDAGMAQEAANLAAAASGELPSGVDSWVQPSGAHDAYPQGYLVLHNGAVWVSLTGDNVYEPQVAMWLWVGAHEALIEDGSIELRADRITTGSITADKITTGSLTADRIWEEVVRSRKVTTEMLTFGGELTLGGEDHG